MQLDKFYLNRMVALDTLAFYAWDFGGLQKRLKIQEARV
jgi:hypothetical protein